MQNLRKVIGPAPSELSKEELIAKIRKRQEFVGSLLQRFREQAMSPPQRKAKEPKGRAQKADGKALGELMKELKEMGMTMEEFKRIARGKGE